MDDLDDGFGHDSSSCASDIERPRRRRKKKKKGDVKLSLKCKWCNSEQCQIVHEHHRPDVPLILPFQNANEVSQDNSFTPAFTDNFSSTTQRGKGSHTSPETLKMPAKSTFWPKMDDSYPGNLQREQPTFLNKGTTKGDKYTLVVVINNTIQKLTVDSGSFLSVCSKKKAKELGLKLDKIESISARAATGSLNIQHSALVTLDFGVVKANSIFSICDHPLYNDDLILLGSNALKELGITANFETEMIYIKDTFPVQMFSNKSSIEQHISQIKKEFISLSAIQVKPNENILLPARSEKTVEITVSRLEAIQLENTYTYFSSDICNLQGISTPDQVIDDKFPWKDEALKLRVVNHTSNDKLLTRNSVLGELKPLISPTLARKLGDDQLSVALVVDPVSREEAECEINFIDAIFETLNENENGIFPIGDKAIGVPVIVLMTVKLITLLRKF